MADPKKVLIIEDDPDHVGAIQDSIDALLGDSVQLITASNGEEGVNMAEREEPDLITLDIVLPKMNGLETLEAIRKIDALKETPVIMLTNMETQEISWQLEDMNVTRHLVKVNTPPEDFVSAVKQELGL